MRDTPQLALDSYLTPNELFFVRHHLPVPDIDPAAYRLTVSGPVPLCTHCRLL